MPRRRKDEEPSKLEFAGFERPESNYFKMPNEWINITAEITNVAELKVVQYILRHTWGYQEYDIKKHITVDEFAHGRRRADGTRMDKGTGLSERAVRYGLQDALKHGLIEEEVDDRDRGRTKKYYCLKMRDQLAPGSLAQPPQQDLQSGVQTLHPGVQELPPRGAESAPRSEKETFERNLLNTKARKTNPSKGIEREDERNPRASAYPEAESSQSDEAATGVESIRAVLKRRESGRRRQMSPAELDARVFVEPFVKDFGRILGDQAPLESSISRIARLYVESGLDEETFSNAMYLSRSKVNQATNIRNRFAYWCATLEDIIAALKEQSSN